MLTILLRTVRTLKRAPGFVAVATLSLAVGIGLSTSTFAIMDSMLHPKIPLADVDRLFTEHLRLGNQKNPPSVLDQVQALEALPGIERVAVVASLVQTETDVSSGGYAWIARTTPNFFETVGVKPVLGRMLSADEIRTKSAVMLSAAGWHRLFPTRTSLDGVTFRIDDRDYPVVGVLPLGLERIMSGDVYLPVASPADLQDLRYSMVIAKLRAGTDSMAIRPQLAVAAADFTRRYVRPPAAPYELQLKSIRPKPPNLRDNELALLEVGIALGVLAIACVNVSALSLARGLSRRRDYALRVALGASRRAIAGEVISEVGVLAVLGTIGGFMLGIALVGMMTHMVPEDLQWRGFFVPELNARVFTLTTLALVGGILIAGGVPAWRASRINPSDPLKDNAGTTTGRGRSEFKFLVIGELAIAMALLMLASLMTLSTRNFTNFDFGFDARHMIGAHVDLSSALRSRADTLSSARKQDVLYASLQRVRDMPGVAAVTTSGWGRFDDDHITSDAGREAEPLRLERGYTEAGANFFSTLGVTMASGRDFSEGDDVTGAVILSRRAAELLFPHGDAVGRMVKLGGERSTKPWLQVVGIAPDIHLGSPMFGETDTLVYAATARPVSDERLVIRPSRDDPALQLKIARALADGLPPKSMTQVGPFVGDYEFSLRIKRFYDQLFSFLGTAALLLGAAGLFSVMSYTVGQRLREFAVRQALGATPAAVVRLVLHGALEMALGGTAVGALLSFWASAGVSGVLFGVKNTDPVSLVVAEATLLLVTMVASLVPALRAMRADPVEVLRAT